LIAKLFREHNTAWTEIAAHFTDRTPVMIKNRYYSHIRRKGLLNDLVDEACLPEEDLFISYDNPQELEPQIENQKSFSAPISDNRDSYSSSQGNECVREISLEDDWLSKDSGSYYTDFNIFQPDDELQVRVTPFKANCYY